MSAGVCRHIALTSYLLLLALVFCWIVWFLPPPLHWPHPLLLALSLFFSATFYIRFLGTAAEQRP